MKLGARGEALIKTFETLQLKAYKHFPTEPWTAGWGHTKGVTDQTVCTPQEAEQWFLQDTSEAVAAINSNVRVPLTQNQFDALVSFAFNVGIANEAHSTLLMQLNAGHPDLAANEFLNWTHVGRKVAAGLERRRAAERSLFLEV